MKPVHVTIERIKNDNKNISRKRLLLIPPKKSFEVYNNGVNFGYCVVDAFNPDFYKFPHFKNATIYEVILKPGKMLYLPTFWFHCVETLGELNITTNWWFKPERLFVNPASMHFLLNKMFNGKLAGGLQFSSWQKPKHRHPCKCPYFPRDSWPQRGLIEKCAADLLERPLFNILTLFSQLGFIFGNGVDLRQVVVQRMFGQTGNGRIFKDISHINLPTLLF